MKSKRICRILRKGIAMFVSCVMLLSLLCSCASESDDTDNYSSVDRDDIIIMQRNSVYENVNNHGEFYSNGIGSLRYFDFMSMVSAPICSKPNCTHTDENECTSFGMNNHPALIGDNIYYFTSEFIYGDDNNLKCVTYLNRANVDGSGRVQVSSIDGIDVWRPYDAYIYDNVIYFTADKVTLDESTMMFDSNTKCICSCDYSTGEFKIYGELSEKYNPNMLMRGYYKDKIYFTFSYCDEEDPYKYISLEEFNEVFVEMYEWTREHTITEVYTLDINTKEIAQSDIVSDNNSSMFARDGYLIYSNNEGLHAIDYNGNETVIPGESVTSLGSKIVNDMLIQISKRKAYNLKTGEEFDLKFPDTLSEYDISSLILKDYIKDDDSEYGEYVFGYSVTVDGLLDYTYIRIPENELIVPNE